MKNSVVVPGEFLAYEEEFLDGKNTINNDGQIFSEGLGVANFDEKNRLVEVKKCKEVDRLKVGTVVIGRISFVRDNLAAVKMVDATQDNKRVVISPSTAFLKIAEVSDAYIESMKQHFKIGDIIKAAVSEVKPFGIKVRTNSPELGVIKAFCTKCRAPMHLSHNNLHCLACGSIETRKISKDYDLR